MLLRSDDGAESWREVGSATPEDPGANFGYSNLNSLPDDITEDGGSAKLQVGLTYETGDAGCTTLSSACRIVYRSFDVTRP